jgi:hypothetical protein
VMTTSLVVSAVTKGLPSRSPPIHDPKLNRLCASGSIGSPICARTGRSTVAVLENTNSSQVVQEQTEPL